MSFKEEGTVKTVHGDYPWLRRVFLIPDNRLTETVLCRFTVLTIVTLSVTLVIGRHFDARWAGGEGYRARSVIGVTQRDDSITTDCVRVDPSRENIQTCGGSMKIVTIGASTVWMDDTTSLVVVNDREGSEELALYGGRIVVIGPVRIDVRAQQFSTQGMMTLVNYSWMYRVDALAIAGDTYGSDGATDVIVSEGSAMSFDTLPPYDHAKETNFSTQSEGVKDFYDWAH